MQLKHPTSYDTQNSEQSNFLNQIVVKCNITKVSVMIKTSFNFQQYVTKNSTSICINFLIQSKKTLRIRESQSWSSVHTSKDYNTLSHGHSHDLLFMNDCSNPPPSHLCTLNEELFISTSQVPRLWLNQSDQRLLSQWAVRSTSQSQNESRHVWMGSYLHMDNNKLWTLFNSLILWAKMTHLKITALLRQLTSRLTSPSA